MLEPFRTPPVAIHEACEVSHDDISNPVDRHLAQSLDKGIVFDTSSNTLLIHGARSTWEGNVAYNDNSVRFETSLAPQGKTWSERPVGASATKACKCWRDCLFFDEPQDPNGINNFLVNVTRVEADGPSLIWD